MGAYLFGSGLVGTPKRLRNLRFAPETNAVGLDYGTIVSVNDVLAACCVGVVESVTRKSSL